MVVLGSEDIQWPCELSEGVKQAIFALSEHRYGRSKIKLSTQYSYNCGVFYVLSGCGACCFYVTQPEKSVGAIFGRGSWLGGSTIGNPMKTISNVEEVQPMNILFFPENRILALAEKEPEVYKWLFACSKEEHSIWLQGFLSYAHKNHLLLCYMLVDIYHKLEGGNKSSIGLNITQQQLAAIIGCTRSKLNAQLKSHESQGYIKLTRNKIIITNITGLEGEMEKMNLMIRDPRIANFQ